MSEPTNEELVQLHGLATALAGAVAVLGVESIELPLASGDVVVRVEPATWSWIPVEFAGPPAHTLVLLHFPGGAQRVGQWNPSSARFHPPRLDRNFVLAPTHWRPLPAGPRV